MQKEKYEDYMNRTMEESVLNQKLTEDLIYSNFLSMRSTDDNKGQYQKKRYKIFSLAFTKFVSRTSSK